MEIRALHEGDDRSQFTSGDADLDRFFHKYAGQNQFRHHLGVTYVAIQDRQILGFATVSPAHVEIDNLPATSRKKLLRYPLPVLRLARLAVEETVHRQGVGAQLLKFVIGLAVRMAEDYGCIGLIVDAKPGATAFYAAYGFVTVEAIEGISEARPVPTPMFLSMRAITDGMK